MSSVNKVILIGHLGSDPDVRTTASGQLVANFSLATSESWTDKQGNRQEKTEWHKVQLWAKLAELAQKWLKKGSQIYVEGKLQTRSWDDQQSGQKRYATEVVGQTMTFLQRANPSPASQPAQPQSGAGGAFPDQYFDADVSF